MNGIWFFRVGPSWLLIGIGCWFGWQLLRQNGRMLLRLEELEKRLDDLEFGEDSEDVDSKSEVDQSLVISAAPNGDDRANRFNKRSLARSRIKRDGLKAGTAAPDFRLPRLGGHGEVSLEGLRGQRLLLVFSDPHCGPCQALAPHLQRFHLGHSDPAVLMISRGEPAENRAKVKQHGLTFPVLLQQRWEISRLYAMFATPMAYLIDERGFISRNVAVGVEPIQALLRDLSQSQKREEVMR